MNPHRKFKNHGGGFDLVVVVLILCFFIFTAFALSAVPHKNNISFSKNKGKYSTQMINKDFNKLLEIRKLLKEAYDHYFDNTDGHCKSQEGHISVEFGNYWEDNKCEMKIKSIDIYSYVFGNSRIHCYYSIDEALEVVRGWHKEEMNTDYEEQHHLEKEYNEKHYPQGYLINPDIKLDKDYWGGPKIE